MAGSRHKLIDRLYVAGLFVLRLVDIEIRFMILSGLPYPAADA